MERLGKTRVTLARNPAVVYAVTFVLLSIVTRWLYKELADGIPDAGMVPNSFVPWIFFATLSGRWIGLINLLDPSWFVWLSACVTYILPQALALRWSTRTWHSVVVVLLLGGEVVMEWINLWSVRMIFFFEHPYSNGAAIKLLLTRPFAWLLVLLLLGTLLGFVLRARHQGPKVAQA